MVENNSSSAISPGFKQIVENSHRIFTVFTGATLSFYVSDLFMEKDAWRFWAVPAVIALMLRYIIGSAIHLNQTYANAKTEPSCSWLFFDIVCLVVFGFLALFIIRGPDDIDTLLWRSLYFVVAGFSWSAIAFLFRGGKQAEIGGTWMKIDGIQAVVTLLMILVPINWFAYPWLLSLLFTQDPQVAKAMIMALAYSIFLYFDFREMVRWARD
jgi:hypothetical protein